MAWFRGIGKENHRLVFENVSHDRCIMCNNDRTEIVDDLNIAIEVAQKAGDESTADLAIGRIAAHEKNKWMLESSI